MLELIAILVVTAFVVGIGLLLRPPPCPGCGSRYSTPVLLPDSVRCAGCWEQIA